MKVHRLSLVLFRSLHHTVIINLDSLAFRLRRPCTQQQFPVLLQHLLVLHRRYETSSVSWDSQKLRDLNLACDRLHSVTNTAPLVSHSLLKGTGHYSTIYPHLAHLLVRFTPTLILQRF
jgi:hypothetical protein